MIAWGVLTIFYSDKDFIKNLNLLFVATFLLIVLAEATLHAFPRILGDGFANGVLTKYHHYAGGIYYRDPVLQMDFMYPNYTTGMYYNGYTWTHQTDGFGFRNAETRKTAAIILLGDSFIYGHGVNIDQTVGHFLEKLTHRSVVNLARQGDDSHIQAFLLTEYIGKFNPRHVLYFFYENDVQDLYAHLTDDEITQFINTPVTQIGYNSRIDVDSAIRMTQEQYEREIRAGSLYRFLRPKIYLLRIVDWIRFIRSEMKMGRRSQDATHNVNDEKSLGWRYTKHAIKYMNYLSKTHGAHFIIVPITPDTERYQAILEKFAREENIGFLDTRAINRTDSSLWLPVDGHFSEKGAQTVARLVAEKLNNIDPQTAGVSKLP